MTAMEPSETPALSVKPDRRGDPEHGQLIMLPRPRGRDRCWQLISLMCVLSLGAVTTLLFLSHSQSQKETAVHSKERHVPAHAAVSSQEKAAAHLQGSFSPEDGTLTWQAEIAQGHLELRNNSLVIPATGMYFVYSQVVFMGSGCPDKGVLQLSHKILLFSEAYPQDLPLMSAQKSVCTEVGSRKAVWFKSIYQGAVFHLNKKDRLSTQTNSLLHLSRSHGKTFFGAFAL